MSSQLVITSSGIKENAFRFGKNGFLFLCAGNNGISFFEEPPDGAVVYAIFFKRGWSVIAAALSRARFIGNNGSVMKVSGCLRISIGLQSCDIAIRKSLSKRMRLFCTALPIALLLCAFLIIGSRYFSAPGKFVGSERVPAVVPAVSPASANNDLIREARNFLRESHFREARLILEELLDRSPDDQEAKRLLSEIDGMEAAPPPGKDHPDETATDLDARAESLLREGIRMSNDQQPVKARRLLSEAAKLVDGHAVAPPYAVSLQQALTESSTKAQAELEHRAAEIGAQVESALHLEPMEALERLTLARRSLETLGIQGRERAIAALVEKIQHGVRSASDAWLSKALSAEEFFGCSRALPLYRKMQERQGDISPEAGSAAGEGVKRCSEKGALR